MKLSEKENMNFFEMYLKGDIPAFQIMETFNEFVVEYIETEKTIPQVFGLTISEYQIWNTRDELIDMLSKKKAEVVNE